MTKNCTTLTGKALSYRWSYRKNAFLLLLLGISFGYRTEAKTISTKKKVCVIGAGPAGLASVKHLADYAGKFDIVAFEKNSDSGGLWIYTDRTDVDEHNLPVHSSMYKNLRTNTPKEIMAYSDYPNFKGEDRSTVTHETVLSYLRNYTDHFKLRQYIQFDTLVEKVTPIVRDGDWRSTIWQIDMKNLNTNKAYKTICNAVMVANGHFFAPYIPKIPGIETFPGKVIHSHIYRRPEVYTGQTVVILGAGPSGTDISIEISKYAKKVHLSLKVNGIPEDGSNGMPIRLLRNLELAPSVLNVYGNMLTLSDGSKITADALIFCTGYLFTYPFLDEASGIRVVKKDVMPLYNHLINIEHPSMCLLGLPNGFLFSTFQFQAQYFVSLLRNKTQLPSKKNMLLDSRYVDYIDSFSYSDDLAKSGGFKPLPMYYRRGSELWSINTLINPLGYKNNNLRVFSSGKVELILHPGQPNREMRIQNVRQLINFLKIS